MRTDVATSKPADVENNIKTDSLKGKPDEPKVVLGVRRTLQPLQKTASGDKENLVGAGGRTAMPPSKEKISILADPKPSKKLKAAEPKRTAAEGSKNAGSRQITAAEGSKAAGPRQITAEDLICDKPSAEYWEALAERRRVALEDALEENRRLVERVVILEEENAQANTMLTEARQLIETLTELLSEKEDSADPINLDED